MTRKSLAVLVTAVSSLLASRPAFAAPSHEPLVVTATASAEEKDFPALMAVAADWRRDKKPEGWCVAQGAGATLTISFDRAASLTEIELHSGYSEKKPAKIQVTSDKGTIDATWRNGNPFVRVTLDPAPTKKLVIKIVSVDGGPRACIERIYVRSGNLSVPMLAAVTPSQVASLRSTLRDANKALETCDAKAIATTIAFPIEVRTNLPIDEATDPMGGGKPPIVAKYANAEAMAAACKKEGSVLALGYQSEDYGTTLDVDWVEGKVRQHARDEVQFGSRWTLVLKDRWRVTELEYLEPVSELALASTTLQEWFANWLMLEKPQVFTTDAKVSVLHVKKATVLPKEPGGYLSISPDDKLGPVTVDEQAMARDGEALWMTVVRKVGGTELRGTGFAVPGELGWQISLAMVSWARPNAEVNKAASANKSPTFEPLPALVGEQSLIEAVKALTGGPLDVIAAKRKDLIALGSGPGEKTVGGAKLAAPWKSAWGGKLAVTGGITTMSKTGNSAFVILDAQLDKGKYKIPFRLGLVFDRAGTGAWTLVHAHIATP